MHSRAVHFYFYSDSRKGQIKNLWMLVFNLVTSTAVKILFAVVPHWVSQPHLIIVDSLSWLINLQYKCWNVIVWWYFAYIFVCTITKRLGQSQKVAFNMKHMLIKHKFYANLLFWGIVRGSLISISIVDRCSWDVEMSYHFILEFSIL